MGGGSGDETTVSQDFVGNLTQYKTSYDPLQTSVPSLPSPAHATQTSPPTTTIRRPICARSLATEGAKGTETDLRLAENV